MSRSHRRPSDYSRGSSPRIDRTLSVTEASFQNLGLSETVGTPLLSISSPYQQPSGRRRPPAFRGELSSDYLASEYDPSAYQRTASPSSFSNLQPSTSFGSTLLDPDYDQLFAETTSYPGRASPFSTTPLSRPAMGLKQFFLHLKVDTNHTDSYQSYHQDTMPSYRDTSSTYATSRSPSQRGKPEPSNAPFHLFPPSLNGQDIPLKHPNHAVCQVP